MRIRRYGNRAGFTKITVWSNNETTAINDVNTSTATIPMQQLDKDLDKPLITLSGIRDSKPQKGVYIVGGKKVLVK